MDLILTQGCQGAQTFATFWSTELKYELQSFHDCCAGVSDHDGNGDRFNARGLEKRSSLKDGAQEPA